MEDIKDLIARITEEVLKRLDLSVQPEGAALAVFSGPVWGVKAVESYLKDNYGDMTCALIDGARFGGGLKTENVDTQQEKEAIAGRLGSFERIVIVTPPLWLMGAIARGDDTVYPAMLAIRPLLWGREVTMALDFEAPKSRRSPAFARIAEDISAIEWMGAKLVYLPQENKKGEPKELVTEQDVKDASKTESRLIKIKPGAIVTQLAQDTAKELGVTIGL